MVTWFIAGLVLYVALNKIRTLVPNFQVKRGLRKMTRCIGQGSRRGTGLRHSSSHSSSASSWDACPGSSRVEPSAYPPIRVGDRVIVGEKPRMKIEPIAGESP
jgi:hypothetical protein